MDPGSQWWDIAQVWITGFIGFYCLAAGMEGFFRRSLTWPERIVFMTAAVGFFFHTWWIKGVAIALLAFAIALVTAVRPQLPTAEATSGSSAGE
jgi:TRAP-type uncharacterized transport system fused permease subunit